MVNLKKILIKDLSDFKKYYNSIVIKSVMLA